MVPRRSSTGSSVICSDGKAGAAGAAAGAAITAAFDNEEETSVRKPRLTYANVMSTIAVMIALGGTSYAAFNLPNNSVTSKKIKDGAVHASDLGNNAVTSKKLANNAVTTSKIADAAVTSSKLANNAVTSSALAPNSVTKSNVVAGSLTGAAFKCQPGDEALDNRDECFFKETASVTWQQAVDRCRARGSTPSELASVAEIESAAALGGSPFATGTFWSSNIAVGASPFTNSTAYEVEVNSGSIVALIATPVTATTVPSIACVYHAADVF
jgi:hypothetical protein